MLPRSVTSPSKSRVEDKTYCYIKLYFIAVKKMYWRGKINYEVDIMDKRIIRILELVSEINEKGEGLKLEYCERYICVVDTNKRCEMFFKLTTKFGQELGYIYLTKDWEKEVDNLFQQAIEQLEARLEELK